MFKNWFRKNETRVEDEIAELKADLKRQKEIIQQLDERVDKLIVKSIMDSSRQEKEKEQPIVVEEPIVSKVDDIIVEIKEPVVKVVEGEQPDARVDMEIKESVISVVEGEQPDVKVDMEIKDDISIDETIVAEDIIKPKKKKTIKK